MSSVCSWLKVAPVLLLTAPLCFANACTTSDVLRTGGDIHICEKCYSATFKGDAKVDSPRRLDALCLQSNEADSAVRVDNLQKRFIDYIAPKIISRKTTSTSQLRVLNENRSISESFEDRFDKETLSIKLPAGLERNICRFKDRWVLAVTDEDIESIISGRSYRLNVRNDLSALAATTVEDIMSKGGFRLIETDKNQPIVSINISLPVPQAVVTEKFNEKRLNHFISADCTDRSELGPYTAGGCINIYRAYFRNDFNVKHASSDCDGISLLIQKPLEKGIGLQTPVKRCIQPGKLTLIYGSGNSPLKAREDLYKNIALTLFSERSRIFTDLISKTDDSSFRQVICASLKYEEPKETISPTIKTEDEEIWGKYVIPDIRPKIGSDTQRSRKKTNRVVTAPNQQLENVNIFEQSDAEGQKTDKSLKNEPKELADEKKDKTESAPEEIEDDLMEPGLLPETTNSDIQESLKEDLE